MNAALLAACAISSANAARNNTQPVYIPPAQRVERPIIGMIRILNEPDVDIREDCVNDGAEIRFRSIYAVDKIIRDLEALKKNMLVLEGKNDQ